MQRQTDHRRYPQRHDQSMGSQRGKNKILILQDKEVKCVHLGDIGCMPTDEELDLLMNIDVLMVPIGGHYTLNKEDVVRLIKWIKPKVIVPMHYRTERFGYDVIGGLDDFLKLLNYDVVYYHQSFMEYRSSMTSHIAVLEPKNHL